MSAGDEHQVDELELEAVPDFDAMGTEQLRDVTRTARRAREWTDKRDAAIVEAHRAGDSLRQIADAAGLSHAGVDRIVKRASSSTSSSS